MTTPRTPPSLKWLINRRARQSGEITKAERAHQLALKLAEDEHLRTIHVLNADISAIDHLIRQHEVAIDPNLIKPIRSNERLSHIDYGSITRTIYQALKMHEGKPCTATQVTLFFASEMQLNLDATATFAELRLRIRHRMKNMAREGRIKRVKSQAGSREGQWTLNPTSMEETTFEQETHPDDDAPANTLATNARFLSQTYA